MAGNLSGQELGSMGRGLETSAEAEGMWDFVSDEHREVDESNVRYDDMMLELTRRNLLVSRLFQMTVFRALPT